MSSSVSLTCLRLPNLLANSNSLIFRALPEGRTLEFTLMRNQEMRVFLKPKNQCQPCKPTGGSPGFIQAYLCFALVCSTFFISWKQTLHQQKDCDLLYCNTLLWLSGTGPEISLRYACIQVLTLILGKRTNTESMNLRIGRTLRLTWAYSVLKSL